MSATSFMKFFPSDWMGDPGLRMCSLAARGLWMSLLCLMHDATPRGELRIGEHIPSAEDIASLVGAPPDETRVLLAELEAKGVFSRRQRTGVIYSRRMVADAALSAKRAAAGRASQAVQRTGFPHPSTEQAVSTGSPHPSTTPQNPVSPQFSGSFAPVSRQSQDIHRHTKPTEDNDNPDLLEQDASKQASKILTPETRIQKDSPLSPPTGGPLSDGLGKGRRRRRREELTEPVFRPAGATGAAPAVGETRPRGTEAERRALVERIRAANPLLASGGGKPPAPPLDAAQSTSDQSSTVGGKPANPLAAE